MTFAVFLQDHVGVSAPETKGADARPPWNVFGNPVPSFAFLSDDKGAILEIDKGVDSRTVQRFGDEGMLHRLDGLDDASDARGRLEVPNIAFGKDSLPSKRFISTAKNKEFQVRRLERSPS